MTTRRQDDRSTRSTPRTEVGVQRPTPTDVGIQPLPSPGHEFARVAEAEARYHQAHAAWTEALRASRGGGSAELARLGLAQQAYEDAKAALDRLTTQAADTDRSLARLRDQRIALQRRAAAIAAQAEAWRRVREAKPARRGLRGLIDRITGRR